MSPGMFDGLGTAMIVIAALIAVVFFALGALIF